MESFFTFIATAVIILGTWVVMMRADGWVTVLVALIVGAGLLTGLYLLVSRRGRKH